MSSSGERFTDIELENKRLPACYGYITWKLLPLEDALADLNSQLPEINQFVKLARKHCTFPNDDNLSKDESATLYLYTMEMSEDICIYRILNQTLRADDRSSVRPWFAYLKLLHSAASKLPKFKGTVWRGINKDVSGAFRKGQKITWWSITSCSTSVDVISTFLGKVSQSTLFNIECSAGKCISTYTCFPNENEVILMPGTRFEVMADPLNHHGGLHIVHLKEIGDDDERPQTIESPSASGFAHSSVEQKLDNLSLGTSILNIPANARWTEDGVTIAGGHGKGDELDQLYFPNSIYVDDDQTVYIADSNNHRIVQWKPGATRGEVVAGGKGAGNRLSQLNSPKHVIVDKETDSLIICDKDNKRVMRWSRQNRKNGEILIDNIECWKSLIDDRRFLLVSIWDKNEVRRYRLRETTGTIVAAATGKNDCFDQLGRSGYLFIDEDHSLYISDTKNHCVTKWRDGAKEGIIVAGGQGKGSNSAQLNGPKGLFVDHLGTVYVADCSNHRVMRWRKGAKRGEVIAGGMGSGELSNQFHYPEDISFDPYGNLYVVDYCNHRVQRFSILK